MAKLFTDGSVVNKSIEWMGDDNKDLSLKTTAALIIANMARTGMLYYGHPYTVLGVTRY